MKREPNTEIPPNDPAAIFAAANSLWTLCNKKAHAGKGLNLSEAYNGVDGLMRTVMIVANYFESWANRYVAFDQWNDVWPYFLEERFGDACLAVKSPFALSEFDDRDCLRVALKLRLPVKLEMGLPVPVDVRVLNPSEESEFISFRIQTVRESKEGSEIYPFTIDDDPFDAGFGSPVAGLYGVNKDGTLEHIADRATYSEAVQLMGKMAPQVKFPSTPFLESANISKRSRDSRQKNNILAHKI